MNKLLYLLPLLLLLSWCANEWYYATTEDMAKVASDLQSQINQMNWTIQVVDEKVNILDHDINSNFWMKDDYDTWVVQCIWIQDITDVDIKKYTDCVMAQEWYCTCLEKYSKCNLRLRDVPREYWKDFKPDCAIR